MEPTKEGIHVPNLLGLMRCLLREMPTGGERELMKLLLDGRRQVLEDEGIEEAEALLESARKEFSWAIHAVAGERLLGEESCKASPTVRARLDLLEKPIREEIVNRVGSSNELLTRVELQRQVHDERKKVGSPSGLTEQVRASRMKRVQRSIQDAQAELDFLESDMVAGVLPRACAALFAELLSAAGSEGAGEAIAPSVVGPSSPDSNQEAPRASQEENSSELGRAAEACAPEHAESFLLGADLPKEKENLDRETSCPARVRLCRSCRLVDAIRDVLARLPAPLGGLIPLGEYARPEWTGGMS